MKRGIASLLCYLVFLLKGISGFTWETIEASNGEQPTARIWHSAAVLNDVMVLFQGMGDDGNSLEDIWLGELGDSVNWVMVEDLLQSRYGHTAAPLSDNETLLVIGGCSDGEALSANASAWTYNPSTDITTALPSIPFAPRCHHSMTSLGSSLVVYGGWHSNGTIMNDMWQYTEAEEWEFLENATDTVGERFGHSVFVNGDSMFVFGGQSEEGFLNDLWEYDVLNGWSQVNYESPTSPPPRCFHSSVVLSEGQLLVFGGMNDGNVLDDMWLFNFETQMWTQLNDTGLPRYGHSIVKLNDYIVVFGGSSTAGLLNDVQVLILDQPSTTQTNSETNPTTETSGNGDDEEEDDSDVLMDRVAPSLTGLGLIILFVSGIIGLACFYKKQGQ